jgi:hypothetical protein
MPLFGWYVTAVHAGWPNGPKSALVAGSDKAPVRLAGLYALERLAQNNEYQRQTIVNVVCAYLRMPYQPPRTGQYRLIGVRRPLHSNSTRRRTGAPAGLVTRWGLRLVRRNARSASPPTRPRRTSPTRPRPRAAPRHLLGRRRP